MVWFIIGLVLVFDFIVLNMSSKCSRLEEKMYIEEFKKNID